MINTVSISHADIVLTDDNSTAVFDLNSSDGMKDWTVDGVDHMQRQWFWYRVGSSGDGFKIGAGSDTAPSWLGVEVRDVVSRDHEALFAFPILCTFRVV